MVEIPKTSVTLLKAIGADPNSRRWEEFYARYSPMLEAFLQARFPYLEAADVIQETMLVMMQKLPNYHYDPEGHGHFSTFIAGVAKMKAFEAIKRRVRHANKLEKYKEEDKPAEPTAPERLSEAEEQKNRQAIFQVAISYVLGDDSIKVQTREIFRRVAIKGESPDSVAYAFGVTRNNVDQIKARMTLRLREKARELLKSAGMEN